jgi:hypothetical protein
MNEIDETNEGDEIDVKSKGKELRADSGWQDAKGREQGQGDST